ncbi:MAG: hypothetical protein ABIM20_07855 [candidate division WOR-3 bacterium]
MLLKIPVFRQFSDLEELKRYIPPEFNRSIVVVKEILDNACDEAERTDYTVYINLDDNFLKVKNRGILTENQLKVIIDFSNRITSKYLKKSYQRGAIGQGLMIAIMLSDIDNHPLIINSNEKQFRIELINREASSPQEVLKISSISLSNQYIDEVEFVIPLHFKNRNEWDETFNYILNYIIANPHIGFKFNGKNIERFDLKKPSKYDISSYNDEELKKLIRLYLDQGYSYKNIAKLFGVKNVKIQNFNQDQFSEFLKKSAKPVKAFYYGKDAISQRIEILNYKKITLSDNETVEIVASKTLKDNILSINGTVINTIYIPAFGNDNNVYAKTLDSILDEFQKKKQVKCLFLYHSPNIEYTNPNKEHVLIPYELTKEIKKFYKNISIKSATGEKDWILIKEKCRQIAEREKITKESILKDYGKSIQGWRYVFLTLCKELIDEMNSKYGAVTIRQVYYQLVSKGYISNAENSYSNLVNQLTDAREMGIIDYFAFEDRSRYLLTPNTVSVKTNPKDVIKNALISSLEPPEIDIWENQDYHLELWIEKDALIKLFKQIAKKYQLNLYPSRGYSSLTKIHEAQERYKEQIKRGKRCIILYFGDLDPSGWNIYEVIQKKFSDIPIKIERIAVNRGQTEGLIPMPLKEKDTRIKSFLKQLNLTECYELDALEPEFIFSLAEDAINRYFDKKRLPDVSKWFMEYQQITEKIKKFIGDEI